MKATGDKLKKVFFLSAGLVFVIALTFWGMLAGFAIWGVMGGVLAAWTILERRAK